MVPRPVGLGGVLDDRDAAAAADLQERLHVGRLAVQVDRQDRPGPPRDLALDLAQVHRVGDRIDVDEDRRGPDVADRPGGGDEGHRDRDDLVARAGRPRRSGPGAAPRSPS